MNSTITGNSAGSLGGGVFTLGTLEIEHSIIAGNFSSGTGPDLAKSVLPLSVSYSLIGNNDESLLTPAPVGSPDSEGNLIGTFAAPIDPLLGPLSNSGGPTLTHALLLGSPAIDADDGTFTGPPGFDQRLDFFSRKTGLRIDMGAYERQTVLQNVQIVVDTIKDEVNGDLGPGYISLREAIGLANGNVDSADTISFDSSLSGQVFFLSMGEFRVIESLVISGLGADHLTIDAGEQSRIFNLDDDDDTTAQDISINGLTLTGGVSQESGGAIFSRENLTLSQSAVDANRATVSGGGIYFELNSVDSSTILESTISNNFTTDAGSTGGGIFITNNGSGTVHILNSTVSGNRTNDDGGGLFIHDAAGTVFVESSTITGNLSDADNSGEGAGGGIYLNGGSFNLNHSIVAGNQDLTLGAADVRKAVFGSLTPSFSLIGDNSGSSLPSAPIGFPDPQGNLIGTSALPIVPLLGPLTNHGGPTNTHALLSGSPAIDTGNPILAAPPATDQRGQSRIEDGDGNGSSVIDIGAYERETLVATLAASLNIDGDADGDSLAMREDPYGNPIRLVADSAFITHESIPKPPRALENRSTFSRSSINDEVFLRYVSTDFYSATPNRPYDLTSYSNELDHRNAGKLRFQDEDSSTESNSWESALDEFFAQRLGVSFHYCQNT
ncbi:MAG: choice-of-anchor Q domain-containing protein [Pirellulales bacterium]